MSSFPELKTTAVAQYPSRRTLVFRNESVRFVDGRQQWYRDSAAAVRRWEIRLDQIDEGEAAALDEFFTRQQGAFGSFEFVDPWDGALFENCSFALDELEIETGGEMRNSTRLIIQENVC
jgi:hypothetical protein